MSEYKPLRGGLLIFEFIRLSVLAALFLFSINYNNTVLTGIFPYIAYFSPNVLFLVISLFVFLRFRDYRSYLPLYAVGKLFAAISFIAWSILSLKQAMTAQNLVLDFKYAVVVFYGSFAIGLADILTALISWYLLLKTRISPEELQPDSSINAISVELPATETGGQ